MDPYPLPVWEEIYYTMGPVGGWIINGYTATYRGQVDIVRRYPGAAALLHPIMTHQPLQITFPIPYDYILRSEVPPAIPPEFPPDLPSLSPTPPVVAPPVTAVRVTSSRQYREMMASTSRIYSNGFAGQTSSDDTSEEEEDPEEAPASPPTYP